MKKMLLFLVFALAALPAAADSISFVFFGSSNAPLVNVDASGVKLNDGNLLAVTNHHGSVFFIPGKVDILTGPAFSYVATTNFLSAQFLPGKAIEVEVNSVDCGGPCIQGTLNTGAYAASLGSTGSFQGLFKVVYVNPFITSLFGDPNTWQQVGSDTFTTSNNIFTKGGTTALADLGGGSVTFQTPVPEPGTLALFGAGFLSLAMFRKSKVLKGL